MEDPQQITDAPVISFKKRIAKGKSNTRKREAKPPPASDSDFGFTSSEDETGRTIKRRRTNAAITVTSASTKPSIPQHTHTTSSATPVTITTNKDDATKTSNWYDESPNTHHSKQQPAPTPPTSAPPSDGTYKGTAAYTNFLAKNPNNNKTTTTTTPTIGPQKSSSNVRTITVTDFAPDVCKDYKQTGFCGFGDSCKFLHAREDYKQGWQLDRDWEINTKGKAPPGGRTVASANRSHPDVAGLTEEEEEDKLLATIPFKCIICKDDYKNPIVTKCGHYFCEACALKRYRKDPSCAACASGTGGVFNVAKKLNKLLERKREREEERTEKDGAGRAQGK